MLDVFLHYLLPLGLAVAASAAGLRIAQAGQIIAAAGVFSGFAFGLAVYVFQLRLESARDPRISKGAYLLELLDELFTNVTYLVVAGLALVVTATSAVSVGRDASAAATGQQALNAPWTAAVLALSLHYILTILMCVKRTRRAYEELTI